MSWFLLYFRHLNAHFISQLPVSFFPCLSFSRECFVVDLQTYPSFFPSFFFKLHQFAYHIRKIHFKLYHKKYYIIMQNSLPQSFEAFISKTVNIIQDGGRIYQTMPVKDLRRLRYGVGRYHSQNAEMILLLDEVLIEKQQNEKEELRKRQEKQREKRRRAKKKREKANKKRRRAKKNRVKTKQKRRRAYILEIVRFALFPFALLLLSLAFPLFFLAILWIVIIVSLGISVCFIRKKKDIRELEKAILSEEGKNSHPY